MRVRQQATRRRVLESAAELFARRGFKRVTIREICRRARANVAAVNYHFRSKIGLYREVVQMGIAAMQRTTAAARRTGAGRAPEEKLQAYLRIYLAHLGGRGGDTWLHRFMARELADPTPALDAIVEHAIRPRLEYLTRVIAELLGLPATDPRVQRCVASVQAQCLIVLPHPIGDRIRHQFERTALHVERLADHIYQFSLAGIQAVRAAPPDD
jgi:TetR/AcrR family transcriptional regulator, regulator of cefoperazone and chloramphenicol sensitivity